MVPRAHRGPDLDSARALNRTRTHRGRRGDLQHHAAIHQNLQLRS
jgi:hypothetical protein